MKAGDVFYPRVKVTVGGVAVTGLVTADFAVAGYIGATTPGASFTVTEESGGWYRLAITTSGTAGWQQYVVSSTGRTVSPDVWAGDLMANDFDTIYAAVIRPSATLASAAVIASALGLDVIANRYTPISVSVTDQNSAVVNLSGYNNWRFNVWTRDHSGSIYTLASGITGSALGVVAWAIPENAAFYSQIDAAIAAGSDSLQLYYDMVADMAGTPAQSRTIFRGNLTLYRYEGAAT
jgi:hypothetical protein